MENCGSILLTIDSFQSEDPQEFEVTYQIFGEPLHQAPIVLVNHALTGNSDVAGEKGWWKQLVGKNKRVNLNQYTVISFDIPGNGFISKKMVENYTLLNTQIVADLFWKGLKYLGVDQLFAVLGGSLGGSIGWEMAFLKPTQITYLIPIACSMKSSDWLIGNVLVQDQILNYSEKPIPTARKHAMHLYRTPESFTVKFGGKKEHNEYAVESWLNYHGKTLENRFQLQAYKTMNHLLKTIGAHLSQEKIIDFAKNSTSEIHIIAIDTDYLFTNTEQKRTYEFLKKYHPNVDYQEIKSIHGHDAFLIEYEQLDSLLKPIFK